MASAKATAKAGTRIAFYARSSAQTWNALLGGCAWTPLSFAPSRPPTSTCTAATATQMHCVMWTARPHFRPHIRHGPRRSLRLRRRRRRRRRPTPEAPQLSPARRPTRRRHRSNCPTSNRTARRAAGSCPPSAETRRRCRRGQCRTRACRPRRIEACTRCRCSSF